jgi:hypothetical protein
MLGQRRNREQGAYSRRVGPQRIAWLGTRIPPSFCRERQAKKGERTESLLTASPRRQPCLLLLPAPTFVFHCPMLLFFPSSMLVHIMTFESVCTADPCVASDRPSVPSRLHNTTLSWNGRISRPGFFLFFYLPNPTQHMPGHVPATPRGPSFSSTVQRMSRSP